MWMLNFMVVFVGFVTLRTAGWCSATSIISRTTELCGPNKELSLSGQGLNSSASIILGSIYNVNGPCKLKIVAPSTHVINLQFSEPDPVIQKALSSVNGSTEAADTLAISCKLSVYVSENKRTPVWEGNPCGSQPLEIELLTPHVRIVWTPPPKESHTRGRRLVVTAVGEGEVCTKKGQFICQKIGWTPKFCIANELVCDGNLNCPKGSLGNDEDDNSCLGNPAQRSWEQLAMEIFKNLKRSDTGINGEWLTNHLQQTNNSNNSITKTFLDWKELKKMEAKNNSNDRITVDNISAALAHYGPWGYLMLGMLICGTVLMFCGLWECCCNHHKHTTGSGRGDSTPPSPPTAVLIINSQQQEDGSNPQPPNYEDLDQPPSYTALFPNYKTCSARNSLAANFVTPDGQIISSDGTTYCPTANVSHGTDSERPSAAGQVTGDSCSRTFTTTVDVERNFMRGNTVLDLNNSIGRSEV